MHPDSDDATYARAWREFEDRHLGHIKRFIEVRLGVVNDTVVDDVVLETVIRIQKGINHQRFCDRGPGKFRSWCVKIAQRTLQDYWRGHAPFVPAGPAGAGELLSFDEIAERYSEGLVSEASEDCELVAERNPDDDTALTEPQQVMREAFATLREVDQVLIWGRINGDSDAYLASITGRPVDSVRKVWSKAVRKLSKVYDCLMAERRKAS
jgi:RNA polymerase sigma factor (sigma-70 family)